MSNVTLVEVVIQKPYAIAAFIGNIEITTGNPYKMH